jgi:hypothetical protein
LVFSAGIGLPAFYWEKLLQVSPGSGRWTHVCTQVRQVILDVRQRIVAKAAQAEESGIALNL